MPGARSCPNRGLRPPDRAQCLFDRSWELTTPSALGEHIPRRSAHWRQRPVGGRFCLVTLRQTSRTGHFFRRQVEIPEDLPPNSDLLAPVQICQSPQVKELAPGEVQVWGTGCSYCQLLSNSSVLQVLGSLRQSIWLRPLAGRRGSRRLWVSFLWPHVISAMKVAMLLATSDWALRPDRPDTPAILPAAWYQAQAIAEAWRQRPSPAERCLRWNRTLERR